MEGTLGLLSSPDSLSAVVRSVWIREEKSSFFLSNYFRFGSLFLNRNYFKCDKRYSWCLRNYIRVYDCHILDFVQNALVLVIYAKRNGVTSGCLLQTALLLH